MEYTPDAWVILRINHAGEIIHKVLGGWYGGFVNADSWRLNSGITRIERSLGGRYRIYGYSGSTYLVHENSQRTTMLMSSVIEQLRAQHTDVQIVDISAVPQEGES